ncbi:MAG: hypothetical protein VX642_06005 [Bdellovibrionota bacterium]|nr:hypothetical protein [Bdellovibrionota bacterium]
MEEQQETKFEFRFVDKFDDETYKKLMDGNLHNSPYVLPAFELNGPGDSSFVPSGKELRLGVFDNDKLVALSWGHAITAKQFQMNISLVDQAYRKQGIYQKMLEMILENTKEFDEVDSFHHMWNNDIIRLKLKAGFRIIGFNQSHIVGTCLRMRYHHNKELEKAFLSREIPVRS